MTKKFIKRGMNVEIPIIGDKVTEIRLSLNKMPRLIFQDFQGEESQITFEETITLSRPNEQITMKGSKPGTSWYPQGLTPLVELLGLEIREALAYQDGALFLRFSNEWELRVNPQSGFEAWHFQYPRPGEAVGGDRGLHISLIGDHGRLISSSC